jgi:lambda family phage tail tape measure protein
VANLLGQLLVELGINTAAFKEGLDKATYQAQAFAKEVSNQFSQIGNSVSGLAASFTGLDPAIGGAIANISGALKGLVGSSGGLLAIGTTLPAAFIAAGAAADGLAVHAGLAAAKVGELSKATGISVPPLSVLGEVGNTVGIGIDQMGKALERMDRSAVAAAQAGPKASNAYTNLGIAVTDASGKMRAADDIFNDVAKRFSEMEDGPQKSAAAIKIFGRAGAEMIPLLDQGGAKLAALEGHFKALGATIDESVAASGEELKTNMSLMQAAFTGIENELAKQLVPALNEVATEFISFFEENHDAVVGWVEGFADAGKIVLNIFQGLVTTVKVVEDAFAGLIGVLQGTFEGLGNASYDALHGKFSAAWQDVKKGGADAANAAKASWTDAAKDISDGVVNIGKVWDATQSKIEKGPKHSNAPELKAPDITWIDKMVQAAERAEAKQMDLAQAIGLASHATIEATATAQSNEEIQKIWDEAVDKGIENTREFTKAWQTAVPAIQEANEWMETFKTVVADQKALDSFNEKMKQQIAAMQEEAVATDKVSAAQAKINASLIPLTDKISELKLQYDLMVASTGATSEKSLALKVALDQVDATLTQAQLNVKALNDALADKAATDYKNKLAEYAAELAGPVSASQQKIIAQAQAMKLQYGLTNQQVEALMATLKQLPAAAALAGIEKKNGFDPELVAQMADEVALLKKQWDAGAISEQVYDKSLADIHAQQADLAAQSGGFVDGIKAGFADMAAKAQSDGEIIKTVMGQAFTGIEDNLAKMIATGKADWQSLITSMEEALIKSQLQKLISGLIGGLENAFGGGGGFGSGFMSAFGGGKERGGDVTPGKWYVVGEKRPEVFVPHTTGTILPSAAAGAMQGGDTHVSMYVQTSDANSFAKSSGQMIRDMTRNVSISTARNRGAY